MKVSLYYESNRKKDYTWLEVPDESEFNVMIERDYQERLGKAKSGERVERRTAQEILTEEISKPTFNSNHRNTRKSTSFDELSESVTLLIDSEIARKKSAEGEKCITGHSIMNRMRTVEEEVFGTETGDLYSALETLSPEQRELLERVFLDGVSQRRIAEEENVSEVAVSLRIKRIRAKLEKNARLVRPS